MSWLEIKSMLDVVVPPIILVAVVLLMWFTRD
jgi:hypothetical protein